MKKIYLFILTFVVAILGIGSVIAEQYHMTCEFNIYKETRIYHIGYSADKKSITSCSYENKYIKDKWTGCGSGYTIAGTDETNDCPPITVNRSSKNITFVSENWDYTGKSYYNYNVNKNICEYTFNADKSEPYIITFILDGDYFAGVSKCIGPDGEFECYLENKKSQVYWGDNNKTPHCPSSFNLLDDGKGIKMMTGDEGTYNHFANQGKKETVSTGVNSSCSAYANEKSCEEASDADCLWVDEGVCKAKGLSCGNVTDIPRRIPELTSMIMTIIQIAIPIILVLMGSIDLFKGITANKEDEMKKGQQMFVKRLVVAAVIFLVVIIVKFFISVIADTNVSNIVDCIECFISNDCEEM